LRAPAEFSIIYGVHLCHGNGLQFTEKDEKERTEREREREKNTCEGNEIVVDKEKWGNYKQI
jgi:hypothetical protein